MIPALRLSVRLAAAAAVVAATAVVGLGAPASAAPGALAPGVAPDFGQIPPGTAAFTGTFASVRPRRLDTEAGAVYRYQVDVLQVYGDIDLPLRVTVQSTDLLPTCRVAADPTGPSGRPGQEDQPASTDEGEAGGEPDSAPTRIVTPQPSADPAPAPGDPRAFLAEPLPDNPKVFVTDCDSVAPVSQIVLPAGGRDPVGGRDDEPSTPMTFGYRCDDNPDDDIDPADLDTCEADDAQGFDRNAAPGLALVIVGALGLLLARRIAKR